MAGVTPLAALADIVESVDASTVRRVNGRRTVTLNIIPPRDIPLESGVAVVQSDVVEHLRGQGEIPSGVNISISGAADQLDATRAALSSNYLVALLIIYLLLVAIFKHWGYPQLIMASIPFGIDGGLIGLWLLNAVGSVLPVFGLAAIVQPFDMISMLGFLILMGTVVNNPILIVHRAMNNMQQEGMDALAAVQEAVDAAAAHCHVNHHYYLRSSTVGVDSGRGHGAISGCWGVGVIVMFGIIGAAAVSLTLLPADRCQRYDVGSIEALAQFPGIDRPLSGR